MRRHTGPTLCALVAAIICAGCERASSGESLAPALLQADRSVEIAEAIRVRVESLPTSAALSARRHSELTALYEPHEYSALWIDRSGRPNDDAREALTLVSDAGAEGLVPGDYDAGALTDLAASFESGAASAADLAAFETRLSVGAMEYLRDLHTGRVSPKALGFRISARADEHDYPALLRAAVTGHRLRDEAAAMTPPLNLYRILRERLAVYRGLAEMTLEAPPVTAESLHPGEPYTGLGVLHRLLVLLGDLPEATSPPGNLYEGEIVGGVKRFQTRHGLGADGVIGRSTFEALRVPLSQRVRQIELSLERLRWLPHIGEGPLVAVNIPMFRVWAWNSVPQSPLPALDMGVIVGRSVRTETPVFIEEMRSIVVRPYWNVPFSILQGEILPSLRKDPGYLDRQNMEIVAGQSDAAQPVPLSPASLERLARRELRVRQRPGPDNSLGLLKFVFPNDEAVYMHGTPATQLFSQARRDFSHGCIRLEDPVGLAEWVLRDQPSWTRERLIEAMQGTKTQTIELARPVQVILYYITAAVMPADGSIRFAQDIYRHDVALDGALASRPRL